MRRPSATFLAIGSVLAGLVVALAVLVLLTPAVEADLVRLVEQRSGIALSCEAFRFVPHHGWVAVDVEATASADGQTITAHIPRLIFAHRWSPLLRGRLVIDRVRLEAPTIDVVSLPPHRPPAAGEPADAGGAVAEETTTGSGRVSLEIDSLRLHRGRVVSRMAGDDSERSEIRGLDLVLEAPRLAAGGAGQAPFGLTSRGELRAESIGLGRFALRDIAAGLEVERGRFRLHDVDVWSAPARFAVDRLEIDLAQSPYRYRVAVTASGVDLPELVGAGADADADLGPALVEIQGGGEGAGLAGAVAEMSIELDAGTLPSLPILELLDGVLGTAFVGSSYEATAADVALAAGELAIESWPIIAPVGRLEPAGRVALDGTLALDLTVALPAASGRLVRLSQRAIDELGGRDGWVRLPLRLVGTWSRPRITLDGTSLGRWLGRRGGAPSDAELAVRSELERWLDAGAASS